MGKEKKDKKEKKEDSGSDSDKESSEEEQDLTYDDELMTSTVRDLTEYVAAQKKYTVELLFEEVRAQQVTKCFDNKLRMFVVVSALFPEASLDAKSVVKHKKGKKSREDKKKEKQEKKGDG